jgi:3-oxoacyl-[acyl-carrier-protein] synthase II
MSKRRVVITGMGTVNPLGNSVSETWKSIQEKKSGIEAITVFDTENYKTKFAGNVKNFDYKDYFAEEFLKSAKRMDHFCHYAVAAAHEAFKQARLDELTDRKRIGVTVGSGVGGLSVQHDNSAALATKGPRRVSPFYIPMSIGNMASGVLSMVFQLKGPNMSMQTACATANHSIATSLMIIQNGMADVMVAGGAEGALTEIAIAGFGNMQALSTRNDDPQTASRPYDKDRDGFVLSEGAALLVLEDYEHAKARGAEILAEVLSCGMSGDAYDFVVPDPEGRGALYSMEMALEQAGIKASDLKYINAHGTSTPVGDIAEAQGIYKLIGDSDCYVGSTKSYHGHLLGATAGIEAIITVEVMRHETIPANINIFNLDPELPPLKIPQEEVKTKIPYALSNSFGFGGHNSSLVLASI